MAAENMYIRELERELKLEKEIKELAKNLGMTDTDIKKELG